MKNKPLMRAGSYVGLVIGLVIAGLYINSLSTLCEFFKCKPSSIYSCYHYNNNRIYNWLYP